MGNKLVILKGEVWLVCVGTPVGGAAPITISISAFPGGVQDNWAVVAVIAVAVKPVGTRHCSITSTLSIKKVSPAG